MSLQTNSGLLWLMEGWQANELADCLTGCGTRGW
jgi:hypothetical protein